MKKGFTLVELLAVIVILAIIAAITIVMVNTIITNSKKAGIKASLKGIELASKYYYIDNKTDYSMIDLTTDKINYDGNTPEKGYIQRNFLKKLRIYIYMDGYCAVKGYSSNDVKLTKTTREECNFSSGRLTNSLIVDNSDGTDLENYRIYGNTADGVSLGENGSIDVNISGKNLLPTPYVSGDKIRDDGVTFTLNSDGSISVVGNNIGSAKYIFTGQTTFPAGTYNASGSSKLKIYGDSVTGGCVFSVGLTLSLSKRFSRLYLMVVGTGEVNETIFPQIELGTISTSYEPYKSSNGTIDLTGHDPLRKVGSVSDYLDYETQKIVRRIGVNESNELYVLDIPIYENIVLPSLSTLKGYNKINMNSNIQPSKIEIVR